MSSQAERDEMAGWAEEVRVAATWLSGRKKRALLNLADRIDPAKKSPPSPEEEAEQQAAERTEAAEQAERDAEAAAASAAKVEADAEKVSRKR